MRDGSRRKVGRAFAAALATTMLAGLLLAQLASAAVWEGEMGAAMYHKANNAYTIMVPTPWYSNEPIATSFLNPLPRSGPSTSPSVWLAKPMYDAEVGQLYSSEAINSEDGHLYAGSWVNPIKDTGLQYQADTSPSVNGYWASIHGAGSPGGLELVDTAETSTMMIPGLGMEPGTSPATFTDFNNKTVYTAFVASGADTLGLYEMTNSDKTESIGYFPTGLGVAPGTSPAITVSGGHVYIAFIAAGSKHLGIYEPGVGGWVDTGLVVAPETSPSIAPWSGYLVAFQSAGHDVGLYQSGKAAGEWVNLGLAMQAKSSPSLTIRGGGERGPATWYVAFQHASTHQMWFSDLKEHRNTGLTMGQHSSPSISGGVEE